MVVRNALVSATLSSSPAAVPSAAVTPVFVDESGQVVPREVVKIAHDLRWIIDLCFGTLLVASAGLFFGIFGVVAAGVWSARELRYLWLRQRVQGACQALVQGDTAAVSSLLVAVMDQPLAPRSLRAIACHVQVAAAFAVADFPQVIMLADQALQEKGAWLNASSRILVGAMRATAAVNLGRSDEAQAWLARFSRLPHAVIVRLRVQVVELYAALAANRLPAWSDAARQEMTATVLRQRGMPEAVALLAWAHACAGADELAVHLRSVAIEGWSPVWSRRYPLLEPWLAGQPRGLSESLGLTPGDEPADEPCDALPMVG